MTVYWLMFLVPVMALLAPGRLPRRQAWVAWWAVGLLFALLMGLRHEVGGDWFNYLAHFLDSAQLGFADAQRFSQSLLDAVTQVASTSLGDDCGEGFLEPSPWATAFAGLDRPTLALPGRR